MAGRCAIFSRPALPLSVPDEVSEGPRKSSRPRPGRRQSAMTLRGPPVPGRSASYGADKIPLGKKATSTVRFCRANTQGTAQWIFFFPGPERSRRPRREYGLQQRGHELADEGARVQKPWRCSSTGNRVESEGRRSDGTVLCVAVNCSSSSMADRVRFLPRGAAGQPDAPRLASVSLDCTRGVRLAVQCLKRPQASRK